MKKLLLTFVLFASLPTGFLYAQDDLLKMLDEEEKKDPNKALNKVTGMFKDPMLINLQSPQTTGEHALNFNISHRFGNIGKESNGGIHTLYGWDAMSDVRISFDYGITRNLQIGVARNKRDEAIDGSLKWRFLEQTIDNKVPLSICAFTGFSFTPKMKSALYTGADTNWVADAIANKKVLRDRFTYTSQIIFARKFASWLSVVIAPTYTHRNYVLALINSANGAEDENDIYSVGAGMRLKLTRSFSVLADYFYVNSKYRTKNPANPYYAPLALGFELETGGHVFHIDFTNATAITANYFIPNSPDSWTKGGYKFGFNISRAFPMGGKRKIKEKRAGSAEKHSEPDQSAATQATSTEPKPAATQTSNAVTTPTKTIEMPVSKDISVEKDMYKVTSETLNMRSATDSNSGLIMKINKGASVEVVEKTNSNWWKIKYNGETGYVSSKFLSK